MKVEWYRPSWWKLLLGALGFKKYQCNYVYGIDLGRDDMHVETSGYFDNEGVLNIVDVKVRKV